MQLDRRKDLLVDEDGVRAKFGVSPTSIPDWLALVGDAADGFPGLSGWGKRSAAVVLAHYVHLDSIPDEAGHWDPEVRKAVRGAERLAADQGQAGIEGSAIGLHNQLASPGCPLRAAAR